MQYITLFISGLLARTVYSTAPPVPSPIKEGTEEYPKLDPRGLVRNDVKYMRSKVPTPSWKPGATIQDIAYAQGQQDMITFIETRVIGRRHDG